MMHEFDTPEDLDAPHDEATVGDPSTSSSKGSFLLLVLALLVLAGGAVYFVGAVLSANNETDAAQASAEDQLELFNPTEFAEEFAPDPDGTAPSSLPLVEEATSTTSAPDGDDADEGTEPTTTPLPNVDPADIALAFINRVPGDEYGLVGYIDPTGERHVTELECARLDLNGEIGICLSATAGLGGTGRGLLLDPSLNPTLRFGVNRPSRAAVSPDGTVVAWTGFSLGHSYLSAGEFATTTQLISVDRSIGANLEEVFTTYSDGELLDDPTRNYWGVTFVDSDHFYATLGTTGGTSIVEGRVSNSRMDVVFENATCPEVSPDGSTIVAKEQRGDVFQLVAIDTKTGARRDLGESRSVDDQVEWADQDTILYALPNLEEGTGAQPVFDVWALDVTPGAEPRLIIPFADSPAA
jgi:hypothetical protein